MSGLEHFLEWPCHGGLNETSVEAEPEGEKAILLFNHTDNLFSLSLPPSTTLQHHHHPGCYFSLGPVKLFILYIHVCQVGSGGAPVKERDDLDVGISSG